MNHTYTWTNSESHLDQSNITMVNLGGESVWYQMNKNRPDFWKAWQAMVTVSTTMS
jgi:hypothetical protein